MKKSQFLCIALFLMISNAVAQQIVLTEEKNQQIKKANGTLQDLQNGQLKDVTSIRVGRKLQLHGTSQVLLQSLQDNALIDVDQPGATKVKVSYIPAHFNSATEQVVSLDKIRNLSDQARRDGLVKAFCDSEDQACKDAIKTFGTKANGYATAISPGCQDAKNALAHNDGMTRGDADIILGNDLPIVRAYYEQCTSRALPLEMQKLIGVLVDLSAPVGSEHSGIAINSKVYLPIGIAVQLAPDRIYTARHVIFRWESDDGALQSKRDLSSLIFIPMNAPQRFIHLTNEIGRPEDSRDDGLVAYDQVMLKLQQSFDVGARWPVVRDERSVAGDDPPGLIVAGFHTPFARALAAPTPKPVAINLPDWPQFVRFDSAPSCRIVTKSQDGCMIHACDTIGGVSGTPIFLSKLEGGRPVVVGVHHGTAFNTPDRACAAGNNGVAFNMAAIPLKMAIQN